MKKILLIAIAFALLLLSSCERVVSFDETLLPGKWVKGTEYYRYRSNHTGVTWDIADDISEEEGIPFEWTLDGADFTIERIMVDGRKVPKYFEMKTLTESSLSIYDNTGKKTETYTKVE